MDMTCSDQLIRRYIAGDRAATGVLVERAATSDEPAVLVAAALVVPAWAELLARAAEAAQSGCDRRLVVIASAHLRGDADRVLLLARDHLADHPDSLLVAHIAAACTDSRETRNHP
ncbi:hypothetical protein ACVGOW_19370 [Pseudonocardia saturnea]